jgi:hypothetical protein
MRLLFILALAIPLQAQSCKWLHAGAIAHAGAAVADGWTSYHQSERNPIYGPTFERAAAVRMAGITAGVIGVSYLLGWKHPTWRRYLGILNLGAAAGHAGAAVYNWRTNPYYR